MKYVFTKGDLSMEKTLSLAKNTYIQLVLISDIFFRNKKNDLIQFASSLLKLLVGSRSGRTWCLRLLPPHYDGDPFDGCGCGCV